MSTVAVSNVTPVLSNAALAADFSTSIPTSIPISIPISIKELRLQNFRRSGRRC